ncbi:MAG: glycosyltransferase family 2 protein [Verrucomicrobiota bacterium]|nr:glycosyltransferase family 2 protein [Verrucomicrobiota bacterium]
MNTLDLSVILPIYNELDNISPLIDDIENALPSYLKYEILCIDDCSTDGTDILLEKLAKEKKHVRYIKHLRNYGQSASVMTGCVEGYGKFLLTMDADIQNDPSDIPKFLKAMNNKVDCVCGIRQKRQDSFIKLFSSKLANSFRSFILHDSIHDAGCGFRILRKKAVIDLPIFNGIYRFIPIILSAQGGFVKEIPIKHNSRFAGVSKYGIHNRLWRGLVDCFGVWWYCRRVIPFRRIKKNLEN